MPTSEALEILKVVNEDIHSTRCNEPLAAAPHPSDGGLSALELLKAEQDRPYIVTFSLRVDEMLGGGVPMGKITEFCGAPGIGKTQFRCDL